MNAIVSVTKDWGIGRSGALLVRNKADMASFVAHTTGETVIMGRTTLESFPNGQPLKNRTNIVLTHDAGLVIDGATCVNSVEEALDAVKGTRPEDVWVIGGESVYNQMLPFCDHVYVTMNDTILPADSHFPDLDQDPSWKVESRTEGGTTADGVRFDYVVYAKA